MPADYTVLDIETSGENPWQHELIAVGLGDKVLRPDDGRKAVAELLSDPSSTVVAFTNYDLRWMILDGAPFVEGVRFHDPRVMAFMLDPLASARGELGLDFLCQQYLGAPKMSKPIRARGGRIWYNLHEAVLGEYRTSGGKEHLVLIEDVPWPEMEAYNGQDIVWTAKLYEHLRSLLKERGMWDRYFIAEEAPLSRLLVEMEVTGMPIDHAGTRDFLDRADEERQRLGKELVQATGATYGFSLTAPDKVAAFLYDEMPTFKVQAEIPGFSSKMGKDIREVLAREYLPDTVRIERIGTKYVYGTETIEGLGLVPPKMRKKKGVVPKRPPIDAETLVMLHGHNPWVQKYLRWKSLNTLCANYLETWVDVAHNDRLHGRYDQARAETGRIASRDPNLQAIPVSMDFNVRTLFRAPMMIGDYSGLDARVAAHFSEDPLLLDIFRNNRDLYGTMAADAWGGEASKKNPNRSLMKILYLSAQYGAQAGSIGDKIRIAGFEEKVARNAGKLLRNMEETLSRMFEWREEVLREAMANGFITTITGRRRYLPELYSDEWWKRTRAERQCVASMVQGTSADIVRRAMIRLRREVPTSVAKIILQVHDEILWELGPDWEPEWFDRIKLIAETTHEQDFYVPETGQVLPGFPLRLPMRFDAGVGDSWEEKDAQGARSYRVMSKGV